MSVAYSFSKGSKEPSPERHPSPGPTKYDDTKGMKLTHDRPPEWSFGMGVRKGGSGEGSVGPGQYDPVERKEGGAKFSIESRGIDRQSNSRERSSNPGPGAYDITNLNKSPNYTFGTKFKEPKGNNVPGPGQYEKDLSKSQSKSLANKNEIAFGSSAKRNKVAGGRNQDQSMGPGFYSSDKDPSKPQNPAFGFSKEPKFKQRPETSPGPGSYNYSIGDSNKKMTIGGKSKPPKIDQSPGPGAYSEFKSPTKGSKQMSTMMSKTPKTAAHHQKSTSSNIGPGSYEASDFLTRDRSPNFNFGKTSRQNLVGKDAQEKPGPGTYNLDPKPDNKKFTIGGRPSERSKKDVPGPGEYDSNQKLTKDSVRTFKFSNSKQVSSLNQSKSTANLGPGAYHKEEDFCKNAQKVSIRGKAEVNHRTDSPGPGGYDPNSDFVKYKSPTYSIVKNEHREHSRSISFSRKDNAPGPGTYSKIDEDFGKGKPKVTIGSRREEVKGQGTPGPGSYEAKELITKHNNPSFRQGSGMRSEIVQKQVKDLPGPGNYNDESKSFGKGVPTFTIGQKHEQKQKRDSPGPGAYEVKETLNKECVRTFKMGDSKRVDIVSKEATSNPGPGVYDVSPKKNGPSYTFNPKPRDFSRNDSPGPGSYDQEAYLVSRDRSVSYKMNNATKRSELVNQVLKDMPGPGNYAQSSLFGNLCSSFTFNKQEKQQQRNNNPGPGAYDSDNKLTKDSLVGYKFDSKTERSNIVNKEVQQKPGPGSYDRHDEFGKGVVSHTIGGKGKEEWRNDSPGPGGYEPNYIQSKDRVVSYKMGSGKRAEIVHKEFIDKPGPGSYDSPNRSSGPHYTIGIKREVEEREISPGPGKYDAKLEITRERVVSHKMGTTQRSEIVSRQTPRTQRTLERAGVYSGTKRTDLVSKQNSELPGPGTYDSPSRKSGPEYTMGNKREIAERDRSPGPGVYDSKIEATKDRVISHKIGSTQRSDIVSKQSKDMPGPGIYDQKSTIGKDGPHLTMGSKRKEKYSDGKPGPGHYEPVLTQNKSKAISYKIDSKSTRSLLVSKEVSSKPGPGFYDSPSSIGKGQKFKIGEKREEKIRNDSPGPGVYEPNMSASKDRVISYKISQSQRGEITEKDSANKPAPGSYDRQDKFGDSARKVTIQGKSPEIQPDNKPGPGAYNAKDFLTKDNNQRSCNMGTTQRVDLVSRNAKEMPSPGQYQNQEEFGSNAKSFKIQGRPKDLSRNDSPGPGKYAVNDSLTRYHSPSAKISKTNKISILSPEKLGMPAPGQYDQGTQFGQDARSFKIGEKTRDQKGNNVPGPGSYEDRSNYVKDRVRDVKISQHETVSRKLRIKDEGPDFYDVKNLNNSPSFEIRGRPKERQDNQLPGPGSYNPNDSLTKDRQRSANFSGSPQRDTSRSISPGKQDLIIGPGAYDSRDYTNQESNVICYTIPKNEKQPGEDAYPGPGHYKIPCKFADVPRYQNTVQPEEFRWV